MHFEYQRQSPETSPVMDMDSVVRNRGGGVPCAGRNGLMAEPASTAPLGSNDHQHQMRLLALRERLRRALFN